MLPRTRAAVSAFPEDDVQSCSTQFASQTGVGTTVLFLGESGGHLYGVELLSSLSVLPSGYCYDHNYYRLVIFIIIIIRVTLTFRSGCLVAT